MRGALLLIGVFLVVTASAAIGEEKGAPAPERLLVAECIKAYGGEQALRKVRTVFATGHIEAFMQGDEGTSTRYFQRPGKLRAELTYKRSAETRILNGSRGWRRSDDRPMAEVIGPPLLGMVYQYKYLDLPYGFLDNNYKITLLPPETVHGEAADVLSLSDAEGPPMRVYLDAKTHLIVRVVGIFSFGNVGTELAAEFFDYRSVEGIRFPFRIINYGGDKKIAETRIKEIRLNQEMRDALFQP